MVDGILNHSQGLPFYFILLHLFIYLFIFRSGEGVRKHSLILTEDSKFDRGLSADLCLGDLSFF